VHSGPVRPFAFLYLHIKIHRLRLLTVRPLYYTIPP
jgi:hypothetical protein